MIRRDYFLRMIEEFVQFLARINSLKREQLWREVSESLEAEFKRLIGGSASDGLRLSETELLARFMQAGPTFVVREKLFMFITLLKEAGDAAVAQHHAETSREYYLKALHLLLGVLMENDAFDYPEFAPKVGMLEAALAGTPLSVPTCAMLMQHYERNGEFARAEDELFAMLEAEPNNQRIVQFGIAFYQRLLEQDDNALATARLPRTEVEEGLKKLQGRNR